MFGSPPLPKASHTEKELDSSKCAQCRNLFFSFSKGSLMWVCFVSSPNPLSPSFVFFCLLGLVTARNHLNMDMFIWIIWKFHDIFKPKKKNNYQPCRHKLLRYHVLKDPYYHTQLSKLLNINCFCSNFFSFLKKGPIKRFIIIV